MNSIQISIEANKDLQEILISQLSDLDADGFEQTETDLIAYFNEQTFKSYEVNELLKRYSFLTHIMEERNWNEVWESNFQPVMVGTFCAVRADFHDPIKSATHEIIITPKMSFGTGHHATTYMMIEQMRNIDFNKRAVFDFGTGTGILAILAEKLGASDITASDVDEWSIENAAENIIRNNCKKISLCLSSQIPSKEFDIILANINRNVIFDVLPRLRNSVKKNGYVLLSGLLAADEQDILDACSNEDLKLIKQSERNNWISLLFINGI